MEPGIPKPPTPTPPQLLAVPTDEPPPQLGGLTPSVGQPSPLRKEAVHRKLVCPSAPAEVGATLVGAIQVDGTVAFISDKLEVTQDFLNRLASSANGQSAETRFRFSSPCLSSKCKQWSGGACSLPERLATMMPPTGAADTPLPRCSVRDQCRWFNQQGPSACRVCPVVVTRGS
jgi:hypothetical protein